MCLLYHLPVLARCQLHSTSHFIGFQGCGQSEHQPLQAIKLGLLDIPADIVMLIPMVAADTVWNLQDLSTCIWALAKLDIGNRKLLDLVHDRAVADMPVLSAKDISYQIWGFAMLGYPLQRAVVASYVVGSKSVDTNKHCLMCLGLS